jgi:hypothetical protein
VGEN